MSGANGERYMGLSHARDGIKRYVEMWAALRSVSPKWEPDPVVIATTLEDGKPSVVIILALLGRDASGVLSMKAFSYGLSPEDAIQLAGELMGGPPRTDLADQIYSEITRLLCQAAPAARGLSAEALADSKVVRS